MKFIIAPFLTFIFFVCTLNKLFDFPLDKIFILLACLVLLILQKSISINAIKTLSIAVIVILFTFYSNPFTFSLLLLFPLVGLLFTVLLIKKSEYGDYLYIGLWWHILIGFLLVIYSYVNPYTALDKYVHHMYDKGMPFLHAAMGFTPTVQTFGTICMAWLLLYVNKKTLNSITNNDKFMFIVVIVSVFLTFNRNTFVLFLLFSFFYLRKLFYLFILTLFISVVYYFNVIESLILNMKTINSRFNGLEGFQNSFIKSDSWLVYLFGRGDNNVWDYRLTQNPLIENGIASMLHSFGIIGFITYGIIGSILIVLLIMNNKKVLAIFLFYVLFIQQIFTTEFYNGSFYIIVAVILMSSNLFSNKNILQNENWNRC